MSKCPSVKLYKYCDKFGLNIIRDKEIRLSKPMEFNDPFELLPIIDDSEFTLEKVKTILKKERFFLDWKKAKYPDKDEKEASEIYVQSVDQLATDRLEEIAAKKESIQWTYVETSSLGFLITSFVQCNDSLLMWAHYADKHGGIVIEFDPTQQPFTIEPCLQVVKYRQERSVYRHVFDGDEKKMASQFFSIASDKGEDWAYEKEVRFITPNYVSNIRDKRFLMIDPKLILSVTFGCRCPIEYRIEIGKLLKRPGFEHVKMFAASINPTKYALDIYEIADG
jgi:hypothetical protein